MTRSFARPPETAHSDAHEIIFDHYDPEDERRHESLLSLGNGILHLRASAPEEGRADAHYPGFYRAGCYARLSGTVEGEQVGTDSLANLPGWLHLAFRLDGEDEWLSLDRVEITSYRQRLDMEAAVLFREATFRDARGRTTKFAEERFVSMNAPHLGALRTRLTPLDWSGRIEVRSGIDGNVDNEMAVTEGGYDPQALRDLELTGDGDGRCLLAVARTLGTEVSIAVATRTAVSVSGTSVATPTGKATELRIEQHWSLEVAEGETVEIEKVGVLHTSRDHAIAAPATAALTHAREAPEYEILRREHREAWAHLWGRCRLEAADTDLSRAATLHAFHLLQTASPHSSATEAGLPSRGWQEAYHGQIFWDETLSLSFLSLHLPDVVRNVLIHRHRRLGAARQRAKLFGLKGALYPWRSATTGHEETPEFQQNPKSGRWHRDDTRLQFHVGSAIAHNVWCYFLATRDVDFMAGYGSEMMVEIARMWSSLARPHPEEGGRYTIRGVVGPDEFHTRYPGADDPGLHDETYTNVMAAWTLRQAEKALACLPTYHRDALSARLKLDPAEPERWLNVASSLYLPVAEDGTFLPFDGYERLEPFDLEAYEREHPDERLDWFIEAQGRDINALKVQKQATFAMLAHLLPLEELSDVLENLGHAGTRDVIRRTIEADLARTSHDSSLSDLIYAGALARLDPKRAWTMFGDALHPDEKSGHSGTEKGIHLGAMAATLDILHRTYLGLQPERHFLTVDPAPSFILDRVCVQVLFQSKAVRVEFAFRSPQMRETTSRSDWRCGDRYGIWNRERRSRSISGKHRVQRHDGMVSMIKALLFDLDGTLTHTDPVHMRAVQMLLEENGLAIDEDGFREHVSGRSNAEIGTRLFPERSANEHAVLLGRKEALFRDLALDLKPLAGVVELISLACERGFPVALVTNAPRENVGHMLSAIGLEGSFDAIVLGDELERGKPDPLPYLTGLARLGVRAEEALAFEDSLPGIQAAVGAGIRTVGVATTRTEIDLRTAGADLVIHDFTDARLAALLSD